MKQLAVVSLAFAIWLANRRRRSASQPKRVATEPPPPAADRSGIAARQKAHTSTKAQATSSQSAHIAPTSPAPSKSIVGAVLQWIFLILLGAALSLTVAKGSWDVFAVLLAAAVLQLGGQLTRWLGSGSGGSSGRRRSKLSRGSAGAAAVRWTGDGGVVVSDVVAPARVLLPDLRLGGVWVKDPERSDSMDEAMAVMRLNGIVRTAVRLIRGLELDREALKAGRFDLAIFSVISFFKVRESYRLDGTVANFNRRDLRRGKHTASVAVQPDGSIVLSISWGEPLAGAGTDHFAVIPAAATTGNEPPAAAGGLMGYSSTTGQQPEAAANDSDLLVVTSTLQVAEASRPVVYRATYVRAGRGRKQRHEHQHS